MKGLGERLKKARMNKGYTQTQAGDKIGISYGTLSGYERDYRNPDNETLIKMAELYGVEVTWLLGLEEKNHPDQDGKLKYVLDTEDPKVKIMFDQLKDHEKEIVLNMLLLMTNRK